LIGFEHITSFNIQCSNDEQAEHVFVHAPLAGGAQSHFLVQYQSKVSHCAEVYHVDILSQSIEKAYDLPVSAGFAAFSASAEGEKVFFTRITESDVTLFSSVQKDELAYWPLRTKTHHGLGDSKVVSHAVSEVVSKDASKYAVRSALVLPSGDWELIRNGDHVWLRPESLAGAIAAGFIEPSEESDLADELTMESHSSLCRAYVHRVKRHFKALTHLPAWIKSMLSPLRQSLLWEHSSKTKVTTFDGFGFQKIIIIATDRGRLIALNTGKRGSVVWNVNLIDLSPGQKWEVMSIGSENGIALIRGYDGEFWQVRISNGTVLHHQRGKMFDGSKIAISVLDALGEKFLVSVKDDGSLSYYPKNNIKEGTIIVTRGIQGAVRGWSLNPHTDPLMAWEFWPALGEVVNRVVVRPAHDPIASIGKALGDRNVLYKYISPNLLLIVTANQEASRVTINILDSASGHTLHTATHSNVDTRRPIEAIVSENWIAYSLFADLSNPSQNSLETSYLNSRAFQLIVSELFKSEFPNERGPVDAISNFSTVYPGPLSDSMQIYPPHIISQAFLLPGPISHISITSTIQGITPRSLLCFLPYQNALVSIPRTLIDPRRPVGRDPSPTELEEGLFKHNPVIDFEPKMVISHKREILSHWGTIISPSLLESTSLVFLYGKIDIFGTRVAPIGEFDMLGKGFSKWQLVGTVVALAIGTGVVAPLVSVLKTTPHIPCIKC
jgi:ER membrane protein complex subunit 1